MQSFDQPAVLIIVSIGILFAAALVDAPLVLCGVNKVKSIPANRSPSLIHAAIVLLDAAECGFCVMMNKLESVLMSWVTSIYLFNTFTTQIASFWSKASI